LEIIHLFKFIELSLDLPIYRHCGSSADVLKTLTLLEWERSRNWNVRNQNLRSKSIGQTITFET